MRGFAHAKRNSDFLNTIAQRSRFIDKLGVPFLK